MIAVAALWGALAARAVAGAQWSAALPVAAALGALLGVLAADLLSGLVHFTCDRFFDERTRLIGPAFIAPFREHHADPAAIARHGFCERNGNNCLAVLPLLIAAHLSLGSEGGAVSALASAQHACWLALLAALAATNEIHALAHREHVPSKVAALQRAAVILSPALHRLHHEAGHGRAYCITTGWCNPLLDGCAAFERLERALRGAARALRRLRSGRSRSSSQRG